MLYEDENGYRDEVIRLMEERGAHVQRHEDKFFNYVPDLSFGYREREGWVEVKFQQKMPKSLRTTGLTFGQLSWLKKRRLHGPGFCFVLVGTPIGHSELVLTRDSVHLESNITSVGVQYASLPDAVESILFEHYR